MKYSKEGTLSWYIGMAFCVIGLLFMFTKEEINDTQNVLKWAMENLPNNAYTRPASAVGTDGESDESAGR